MHEMRFGMRQAVLAIATLLGSGCLPYTVASTARPARRGEVLRTATWYTIPNAVELAGDSVSSPIVGADAEARFGIDDRSDIGVRLPSFSGVVVTYKRRLDAPSDADKPAVAAMLGTGFVNWGEHAHFEATLMASGRERTLTPYGGLRAMQVAPMSRGAVHDSPTLGGFLGVRIGRVDLGVSPEIGVYYDRSALGLRSGHVIVVPALSVHGTELMRILGGGRPW